MGFDGGVIIACITAIGGLAAYIINEVRIRIKTNLDLEKRISNIEQQIAVNDTQSESDRKNINDANDDIKDMRFSFKEIEERTRLNEIDIAVIKNDTQQKRNS